MIVRNESRVIARALTSAVPWIDTWLICDTGSTDGTQEIIREQLASVPGELHEVPWLNFGHNRTQAVELARSKADYLLILDADLVLSVRAPFRHKLTGAAYDLRYEGALDYVNTRLISTRHPWHYVGATHEYITSPEVDVSSYIELPELRLIDYSDGGMRADKFERDIRLLSESIRDNPDNPRDVFYLAQSYKDLGSYPNALRWYRRRAQMAGFEEERWSALYQTAQMMEKLGGGWEAILAAYLEAYAARPTRLESLYQIARHYREAQQFEIGFTFAATWGAGFPYPTDKLFIDKPVYTWGMAYEYAYCALNTGRYLEAIRAFEYLETETTAPDWLHSPVDSWIWDSVFREGRPVPEEAAIARSLIGSDKQAVRWLYSPNASLEHRRPIDFLDTDVGRRHVRNAMPPAISA